ncbi:Adenylate cyclase 9 [Fasciola hepatica]|uniref:adenylate cyclase n=1 Tax=Fasciola hepatica TaxID=6192 RepID=A0A4E0RHS3_FASHE|nr:Adenylate cyclase 9 [Fasciola hepatica]
MMRGWHQGVQSLQRQPMHSHLLVDLFAEGRSGFSVIRQYYVVMRRVLDLLEFQSNFINDYFRDLWLNRTKHTLRVAIKFFIVTCTLIMVEPTLICPVDKMVTHTYWHLSFVGFLAFYLYSFRNISHEAYANVGLAICLMHITAQLPLRCEIYSRNAPLLSPAFVTIFTTFVMLPIRLELALCLVIVFIVILEALDLLYDNDVFQLSQGDVQKTYTGNWINYDLSQITGTFSRIVVRSQKVLSVRLVLWIIVCVSGIYMRSWNTIRRRYAFYKLGKSVQARSQCTKAHQGKVNWIEAVMPLQVSEEYQRMRKINDHFNVTDWVYIRTYENVSILFADVVGFTTLSSKLTALQIVTVLGELITQFDEVCQATHCEKLGVLGDCYYCMAGCLEYQPNNAMCCTEMGLGMCEILRLYNIDHQYAVNIRVGVHTGRVHTAILGSQRFRYDVYSYDVMIANELEATGRPGCVHISEDTYDHLQGVYTVVPGPDLVVDKRDTSFLRRRTAATVRIRTYFIEPDTVRQMLKKPEEDTKARTSVNTSTEASEQSAFVWSTTVTDEEDDDSSEIEGEHVTDSSVWADFEMSAEAMADIKLSHQTNAMHLKRDMEFIEDLRSDPAKHSLLFHSPPVSSFLLRFNNPEVEWHYQLHVRQKLGPTYVDSEKLSRVVDTTLIFIVLVILCFLGIMNKCQKVTLIIYAVATIIGMIIFVSLWLIGTNYPETIRLPWLRSYYMFCSHPLMRELLIGIYTCLPTMINVANRVNVLQDTDSGSTNYLQGALNYISLLVHSLPSSSAAWARTFFCTLSLALLSIHWVPGAYDDIPYALCLSNMILTNGLPVDRLIVSHYCQLLVCLALVVVLARENERICKLCFYVHREAEIESEAAEKAVLEANDLLYNIIPAYVFEELKETGRADFTSTSQLTLRYAVGHLNVGVAFVSVSNFFSTLYREDQGGGERSLRSLHKIICSFDELLRKPEYKDVEKIKSMHENYLVAAGLNRKLLARNRDPSAHLVALMNYCFDVRQVVQSFHTYELLETGPLVPKLGFNCGPLTAGIIGTAKPHYDIWGDTVNVASRMCYNSIPGPVQVPQWVRDKLYAYFPFKYRGEIFIKGKGMMRTYFCDTVITPSDSSFSMNGSNH